MKSNHKIQKIKMLLLDVDGVLTDGSIIYGNNGIEIKAFDVQDGFGIRMAQQAEIKIGIITGRTSEAVIARAKDLELDELHQGQIGKLKAYHQILAKYKLGDNDICYIGDDLFDLPVLTRVGFSVAVANARDEVKNEADYITRAYGGKGAVREVTDLILKTQNKWPAVLEKMINYDG